MYINEVKRDKETLKKISEFQCSIENLVSRGCLRSLPGVGGRSGSISLHPVLPTVRMRSSTCRAQEMDVLLTAWLSFSLPSLNPRLWRPEAGRFVCSVALLFPCPQGGQWAGFGLGVGPRSSQPESWPSACPLSRNQTGGCQSGLALSQAYSGEKR
jgi:hypothetical protein